MRMKNVKIIQINENIKINSSPYKLKIALNKVGVNPKILTLKSVVQDDDIIVLKKSSLYRIKTKITSIISSLEYKFRYDLLKGFPFSYYSVGIDISVLNEVKDADVIMMHWVCGGFITPQIMHKISKMNKKIVWVCHDSWPFTGGCHVRMGCEKFKEYCGNCVMLNSNYAKDWSYRLLKRKKKYIDTNNLTIVSPSNWMDKNVSESALFRDCKHLVIPNPIDIDKYKKGDKESLRKKYSIDENRYVILFGAVNSTSTPYKGFSYLVDALRLFYDQVENGTNYEIVVFGSDGSNEQVDIPFDIKYLGQLNEERMIEAYSLADVYITPTLDDNLPNTVMESLACELPVVSFDTGGVSDMVEHLKNGYLAKYADSEDLANGIRWVLNNNLGNRLGKNGREVICDKFEEKVVAEQYKELLCSIINS